MADRRQTRTAAERGLLWGSIVLAVISIALIVVGLFTSQSSVGGARTIAGTPPRNAAPVVGYYAPDFTLRDLTNTAVHLRDLRGHPVILNFWYLACEGCRQEMPLLQTAYVTHEAGGTIVLGININDGPSDAKPFAHHLGITYPLIFDSHQTVLSVYTITATPSSFFIDHDGIIRATQIGELDTATLTRDLTAIGA